MKNNHSLTLIKSLEFHEKYIFAIIKLFEIKY